MSIQGITEKINHILGDDAVFYAIVCVLVGVASFGFGRASVDTTVALTGQSAVRTSLETGKGARVAESEGAAERSLSKATSGSQYVGSVNSDKYHLPWCPGAKQIAERNKIVFTSVTEAEAAGYVPAGNCKGL